MDFKEYDYIKTIAETGNITHAAEKLYVSQPYLSKFLKNIEEDIGTPLFNRNKSPLTLTYAGEEYIKNANDILKLHKNFLNKIENIVNKKEGLIRIGVPSSLSMYLMPKVLPTFHERFPKIIFSITEGDSNFLSEKLRDGELEIILINGLGILKKIDINYEKIFRERYLLAIKQNSPSKDKIIKSITDINFLKESIFLLRPKGFIQRNIVENFFYEANFQPKGILEISKLKLIHPLCEAGMGVTFIPEIIAKLSDYKTDYFEIINNPIRSDVYVGFRKGYTLSIAEKELLKIIKEFIQKL
ncbi:MAG: LysR family transcriptional regulator [Fusobacteriaceae bacterium]